MDLPWISRLISSQIQQKSELKNLDPKKQTQGSQNSLDISQNQELLRGLLNGSPEFKELKLSDIASIIPQIKAELSQYLLAQLNLDSNESISDSSSKITQLLKQIIDTNPPKNSQAFTQIIQQWVQEALPQQTQESQSQAVKQLTKILQPILSSPTEPQAIQSQVREFLGLLEQNKLEAISSLKFTPTSEIQSSETLTPTLRASSQSELQSLVQNFSASPKLPDNLAQLLQTLSQGQKVDFTLEEPKVFTPQEFKQQEPTSKIAQAVEQILTKAASPNVERQLWTLYPLQTTQSLLTPPIDSQLLQSTSLNPQEIKQIHEAAQIPPTFRSLKDLEFLKQVFNESTSKAPIPDKATPAPIAPEQAAPQAPPAQEISSTGASEQTNLQKTISPQLFKEFHQLNYLLETKLPASESPSPVEQEKLLLSLLNLKQSQGLQKLGPELLTKIFHNTSLSDWIQNPSSLLPKLNELPQQVSQALVNLFAEKPILEHQELTRNLTQLLSQQPELKELPIVQKLEHFTQWNQLEQEKSADAPKEQSIYWTNGEELIHSKIQVQDERENQKGKADAKETQSLVLYTQAPTLGDITARLKRVKQDSDELNLTIEDSTGAYSKAFEEEKSQFEQDLLSIGFELSNFIYKARLLKPQFNSPSTPLKTSEIDLQA